MRDHIAWTGISFYRGKRALSANVYRTQIEIVEQAGAVSDRDFLELLRAMTPADRIQTRTIFSKPFAELTYQHRHSAEAADVPIGYWYHRHAPPLKLHAVAHDKLPRHSTDEAHSGIMADFNYVLDSAFLWKQGTPEEEIDYLFRRTDDPGMYSRLLTSSKTSSHGIEYPPRLDEEQFCRTRQFEVDGHTIHHAYLTVLGCHHAVWRDDTRHWMLIVKPARWTTIAWFESLVAALVRA